MDGDTGSHRDSQQQRRPHSNTVSGDRPPAIDTSLAIYGSPSARRNSGGSPRLPNPPPISISEPTPVDPMDSSTTLSLQKHFPDNDQLSSRASSPTPTPIAAPEQPAASNSTSAVSRLLATHRKSRSRASSLSTAGSVNDESHSQPASEKTLPKLNNISGSKLRNGTLPDPRRGSELTVDTRASSEKTPSMAAGSIAAACNLEVASAKRNQDFHALFRSVPEEDPLIEDFGCALQKEILLQGRIYISENHLCFNANIFGWVTNLVIAFKDIVDIEKKTTALFIPNAIQVSTLHAKHFFASFLSRDQAYELIVDIWRCSRPKENDENGDSRNSQNNSTDNDDYGSEISDASSGSYVYTDDEDASSVGGDDDASDSEDARERQVSLASLPLPQPAKDEDQNAARRRAISEVGPRPNVASISKDGANGNASNGDNTVKQQTQQTREKTECACGKNGEHFPKVVLDQTFDCTIENLYNLLYFSDFTRKFLVEQKNTDVSIGDWRKGDGNALKTREMSYIKPLNGSIGPKQTKCLLTEEFLYVDLDDYVTQLTTTQTPDVPSGSSFMVKTRVCLMWAGKGQVRMLVTVLVEFSKSSWLKSTIENASINGQESYYKELDAAIRRYLSSQGERKKTDKRKKVKRKRRHKDKEDKNKQKEEKKPSGILQMAMDKVDWVLSNVSIPSAEQATALLMLLLVFSNIFIASKMAQVDKQLQALSDKYKASGSMYPAHMHSEIKTDENELWEWLGRIDPDHDIKTANIAESVHTASMDDSDDVNWDNKLKESQMAKEKLDEHMADLEKMIQRARSNMEQVTKVVDQQRQRILSEWSA